VVVSFFPFHSMKVLATKPLPFTVIVKSALPALMFEGERNDTDAPVLL
jgi:hypothetical protein